MKVLFAAPEPAWGGILDQFRRALPDMEFDATGGYHIASLAGYDALIPTMTRVDSSILESADRLRLIQQMGAGLEGVDIADANARGIAVANVPSGASGNADSVAELGVYLLIGLARQAWAIPEMMKQQRLGRPMGMSLQGKTVGLIGLGDIGKALIRRLTPFGVRLIGIKATAAPDFARDYGLAWCGVGTDLDRLLAEADFAVLSLPDNQQTHGLFDHRTFARMKPGAMLVNLGRGGVIDRDALFDALKSGHLGGAGLDVYWQEPPDPEDPIFACNILATPHIGGVTDTSLRGIFAGVSENLQRLQRGEPLLYCRPASSAPDGSR